MKASIFTNYIERFLGPLTSVLTTRLNDSEDAIVPEYKQYLRPVFSPDMKFSTLSSNRSIVAADVVAMDSELPLKMRGSYKGTDGSVPKVGTKRYLNESQITQIENMIARGNFDEQVVQSIFNDLEDCIVGYNERLDAMFYQSLSTGKLTVTDEDNVGVEVNLDFGVPADNKFGVTKPWTEADATPIDDMENALSAARNEGVIERYVFMDKETFNGLKSNDQFRKSFAGANRVDSSLLFRISNEEATNFILSEFGLIATVVDKIVTVEIGGSRKVIKPWQPGKVVFTPTNQLGTLTWSQLAEARRPVEGVQYGVVDQFILTSMFRINEPFREYTSAQGLSIPVIGGAQSIFMLDTKEANTASLDVQTEGDANYDYQGTTYTKQSVVDGINAARSVDDQVNMAAITQKDETLAKKIDQLSEEGIALFEAELIAV